MTSSWYKVSHKMWEIPMTMEERYMMLFLLDCEDRYNCSDDWFCVCDTDFINAGFGRNKNRWKKYRDSLVQRGWIEYIKGGPGRKSKYRINRKKSK